MEGRRKGMIIGMDREEKQSKIDEPKRIGKRILPIFLTTEILSRLPAKSLVRFRGASKLWQSITHDPQFIEDHLGRVSAGAPNLLLVPCFIYQDLGFDELTIDEFPIIRLDCCDNLSNPKPLLHRNFRLRATSNGLLCLSDSGIVRVVNPATGESLTLPQNTLLQSRSMKDNISPYFGFEPEKMEYKVVLIFWDHYEVLVYTLGVDTSWRSIHSPLDFHMFNFVDGVVLKGVIYWPIAGRIHSALCFDLKDERFHPATPPDFKNFYTGWNYRVNGYFIALQDTLCLPVFPYIMSSSNIMPRMDIWAMTSSSHLENEWCMMHSVMFPWDRLSSLPEPLLIYNDKILLYNYQHETSRLRYHDLRPNSNGDNNIYEEVYRKDEDTYRRLFVHVESLVPLPN